MKTAVQLREERAGLITQARTKLDDAQKREGGPTAEDRSEINRLMDSAQSLKDQYETMETVEAAEADLDSADSRVSPPIGSEGRSAGAASPKGEARTAADFRASEEYRSAYSDYLATGQIPFSRIPREFRDTVLGTDGKGGYLVTPTQLAGEIVKAIDDMVFVRGLARIQRLRAAKSLGVPRLTSRMADADWTSEVGAVTEDTTMAVDRRDLKPYLMSKLSKVSIEASDRDSNVEALIRDELVYKNAVTEEKAYLTGSGTGRPLGIFTASSSGVPTSRDVTGTNTTTAIGADTLIAMKYSLKPGYRSDPTCRWVWSRAAIEAISKLKDSTNQYLWQPSVQAGQPDRLLGIPVAESEYVPATFTTGLYVGAIGVFRYYWIAEVDDLRIQRLVERYADTNEVGFISRRWVDGAPILAEAFTRCKLG
ncbi:phage major capsid protein [Paludisphaera sp.]|uniref:phage major capsid protein n=1 Tax=Paludisphaera sp. TaxID=2017432 RepID=UPI00301B7CDA